MDIKQIAQKINNAGGKLYLVGGAIRDSFLNLPITDEDYCITGLAGEEFNILFPEAILIGKKFKVFKLDNKEFAIARQEIKKRNRS